VYARWTDFFSRLINALAEPTHLTRTLVTNGMRIVALNARSRNVLPAQNLFLRKQRAFYKEHKATPRRFDNISRFMLNLLAGAPCPLIASRLRSSQAIRGWVRIPCPTNHCRERHQDGHTPNHDTR
jgi:hypothetical protein